MILEALANQFSSDQIAKTFSILLSVITLIGLPNKVLSQNDALEKPAVKEFLFPQISIE